MWLLNGVHLVDDRSNTKRCAMKTILLEVEWCTLSMTRFDDERRKKNKKWQIKNIATKTSDKYWTKKKKTMHAKMIKKKYKKYKINKIRTHTHTHCFAKNALVKVARDRTRQWQHSVFWYLFYFVGFATYLRG